MVGGSESEVLISETEGSSGSGCGLGLDFGVDCRDFCFGGAESNGVDDEGGGVEGGSTDGGSCLAAEAVARTSGSVTASNNHACH